MLRAVEEAEVAVGGCRYETAMTEAKVRDLGEAVAGVARKVREVEKEWEEVEEERGGKKGRRMKPKPGDAGVEAVRWRAEDGVKGGLFW